MKNRDVRLLNLLMATAFGWSVNAGGTNELMTGDSYTAELGKCRITLSKYGTISNLQVGGKKIISESFLLLHYADVPAGMDRRIFEQANREDAGKNPAGVIKEEHAVILTKKSILGHPVNPESVLVNREIKLDDKGKLDVKFEIEYLKDVVFTSRPIYLMQFDLGFMSGGYLMNGKLGVIQERYTKEGEFRAGGKKIQFATEFGPLSLEAMDNTGFSGYDLRRESAQRQALRIDAFARSGPHSQRYSFPKGTKQSFGFTITLPGF